MHPLASIVAAAIFIVMVAVVPSPTGTWRLDSAGCSTPGYGTFNLSSVNTTEAHVAGAGQCLTYGVTVNITLSKIPPCQGTFPISYCFDAQGNLTYYHQFNFLAGWWDNLTVVHR